jgi:lipopolysaccharide/colanic/teichoic acid biosynthesis glycosyltransferase
MVVLLLSETVLLFACYCAVIFFANPDADLFLLYEEGLLKIALVVLTIQIAMFALNLYSDIPAFRILLLQKCLVALGSAFFFQTLVFYLNSDFSLPQAYMIYGSILALFMLSAWRILFATIRQNLKTGKRLLLVGVCPSTRSLAEAAAAHPDPNFLVAGYLHPTAAPDFPAPYLGSLNDLPETLQTYNPSHILIATQQQTQPRVRSLLDLQWAGLWVQGAPEFYETTWRRVSALDLQPDVLILSSSFRDHSTGGRLTSALLGIPLLLFSSPVWLLTSIYLKLSAPSLPVLQRLPRSGLHGELFLLYRFRATRFARLPELLNLVRGDLSMVGPEPLDPVFQTELENQIPFYQQRLVIRPGIWGWAQLNMASSSREDTLMGLEYDLYYIKNQSLHLSVYICLHQILLLFSHSASS